MSGPVAILMVPSTFIGWLAFGAGGDASPWTQFFAPMFPADVPVPGALPDWVTSAIVLVLIVCGFGAAFARYGNPRALLDAVPRLRAEAVRTPAVLANAFYFDAAIDAIVVKPAAAAGRWFGSVVDPRVIDAGVREASISANWLGHLFRSFETGLVRAYALTIAFGVACFAIYYVVLGIAR
jgi:NADH:ubiquinone oxidoreductase subunit 5 (subunit L)/multisubunit Na+/H+ antiporter MnhA subunit